MKLSDAILLGSLILKPKCGVFANEEGEGCALGMASKASGGQSSIEVGNTWPWLEHTPVKELPCGCIGMNLMGPQGDCFYTEHSIRESIWMTIVHLFNQHVCDGSWTIERLVDWVRSVEPQEDSQAGKEEKYEHPQVAVRTNA